MQTYLHHGLLAQARIRNGESYLAGGATLNELLQAPRVSRDIDMFHDTEEALAAARTGGNGGGGRLGTPVSRRD